MDCNSRIYLLEPKIFTQNAVANYCHKTPQTVSFLPSWCWNKLLGCLPITTVFGTLAYNKSHKGIVLLSFIQHSNAGVVLGRAATTLRSIETQPLDWMICSCQLDKSSECWARGSYFLSIGKRPRFRSYSHFSNPVSLLDPNFPTPRLGMAETHWLTVWWPKQGPVRTLHMGNQSVLGPTGWLYRV